LRIIYCKRLQLMVQLRPRLTHRIGAGPLLEASYSRNHAENVGAGIRWLTGQPNDALLD
jgi:hypothetical protein